MKLHDYLQERDIAEADFGERIGCSQSQVNRIRHGKSDTSPELIARIRDVTDGLVSFDDFYPPALDCADCEAAE